MIFIILSILGLTDTLLLYWNSVTHGPLCIVGSCSEVLTSSYATIGSVPLSIIGIFFYFNLFFISLLLFKTKSRTIFIWFWILSLGGFLSSLSLLSLQAFVIHAWCLFCVISSSILILNFILISRLPAKQPFAPPTSYNPTIPILSFSLLSLGLTFGVFWAVTSFFSPPLAAHASRPMLTLADLATFPSASAELPANSILSHQLGVLPVPYTVTIFFDFECSHCAVMHEKLRNLQALYPYTVTLIYRHFPLQNHSGARLKALASICAAKQGKFETVSEAFFKDHRPKSPDELRSLMTTLGLDLQPYQTCMDSPFPQSVLDQDFVMAQSLKIRGTPSLFVYRRY